jgi:hypothetical protein
VTDLVVERHRNEQPAQSHHSPLTARRTRWSAAVVV